MLRPVAELMFGQASNYFPAQKSRAKRFISNGGMARKLGGRTGLGPNLRRSSSNWGVDLSRRPNRIKDLGLRKSRILACRSYGACDEEIVSIGSLLTEGWHPSALT